MAVHPMTITHSKQVKTLYSTQVWPKYKAVLILLVRVSRDIPNGGCKCELCDHIVSAILTLCWLCIPLWLLFLLSWLGFLISLWAGTLRGLPLARSSLQERLRSLSWLAAVSSIVYITLCNWLDCLRREKLLPSWRKLLLDWVFLRLLLNASRTKWLSWSNWSNLSIIANLNELRLLLVRLRRSLCSQRRLLMLLLYKWKRWIWRDLSCVYSMLLGVRLTITFDIVIAHSPYLTTVKYYLLLVMLLIFIKLFNLIEIAHLQFQSLLLLMLQPISSEIIRLIKWSENHLVLRYHFHASVPETAAFFCNSIKGARNKRTSVLLLCEVL